MPDLGNRRGKVAFGPDGRRLLFTDGTGIAIWDISAHRPITAFDLGNVPDALAVSEDGRTSPPAARMPDIAVWDR